MGAYSRLGAYSNKYGSLHHETSAKQWLLAREERFAGEIDCSQSSPTSPPGFSPTRGESTWERG